MTDNLQSSLDAAAEKEATEAFKKMLDTKGIIQLDMDSPTFHQDLAAAIEGAIGHMEEHLTFAPPQFDRTDGITPSAAPTTHDEWASLPDKSEEELRARGLIPWGDHKYGTLWLFPAEWYESIPDGMPIMGIDWEGTNFCKGKTDNDRRQGVLGFGTIKLNDAGKQAVLDLAKKIDLVKGLLSRIDDFFKDIDSGPGPTKPQ